MRQLNDEQRQWLSQLYIKEYDTLLVLARRRLPTLALAEEAVQKAFLTACEKVDVLMISPRPGGWLTNTLINTIGTIMRSAERANSIFISEMGLDENLIAAQVDSTYELDDIGVRTLGQRSYSIMKSVLLKDLSIKEAAAELGISIAACQKRIQRDKKKLQEKLKGL